MYLAVTHGGLPAHSPSPNTAAEEVGRPVLVEVFEEPSTCFLWLGHVLTNLVVGF